MMTSSIVKYSHTSVRKTVFLQSWYLDEKLLVIRVRSPKSSTIIFLVLDSKSTELATEIALFTTRYIK